MARRDGSFTGGYVNRGPCSFGTFHDLVLCRKPSQPLVWVAKCISKGCYYSCAPDVELAKALTDCKRVEDPDDWLDAA